MNKKRIKVVIAKPGLDGHDTGAKVVVHALKDAGMEVIYTGLHRTIDEIVNTAVEEDVDVIGLSIYSGAHLPLSAKLMFKLREEEISDKIVLVGGNIPPQDIPALKNYGIAGVFPIGASLDEIITFIEDKVEIDNEEK
ncbi:cobalamin B12-binding domain-containing protein [candidate division CSSED10-310 bacterium]|uniref:Cobalamin B12-binding domain-containing protein n=1 Tax=candidate division CSSED10-310 bacterium TaxID=2855610 RepID=A0ABV6YT07_UNCC1